MGWCTWGVVSLHSLSPFNVDGKFTHHSNETFDQWLKAKNPAWGVRDIDELAQEAVKHGITLIERVPMPRDNFTLIWRRE